MNIKDMAVVGGISEATMRRYENPADPSDPGLLVIAKICYHYGISMDFMLFGKTDDHDDQRRLFLMIAQNLAATLDEKGLRGYNAWMQSMWDRMIDFTKAPQAMRGRVSNMIF